MIFLHQLLEGSADFRIRINRTHRSAWPIRSSPPAHKSTKGRDRAAREVSERNCRTQFGTVNVEKRLQDVAWNYASDNPGRDGATFAYILALCPSMCVVRESIKMEDKPVTRMRTLKQRGSSSKGRLAAHKVCRGLVPCNIYRIASGEKPEQISPIFVSCLKD